MKIRFVVVCLLAGTLLLACDSSGTESDTRVTKIIATRVPTLVLASTAIKPAIDPSPTATPTAAHLTVTLTTDPTDTPFPLCTPLACQEGEVHYCPGDCPGGCGAECATPTAEAAALPVILSFTTDRPTIVEGESVNLAWRTSGGDEAYISWVAANAMLAGPPGPLDPNGGRVSVNPTGDGDIRLIVMNGAGSVEAHIQLTIECPYEWAPALAENPPSQNCPWQAGVGAAAQQSFEGGFMIWLEPSREIYVFYNAQGEGIYLAYSVIPDEFSAGDPESDPSIVPPAGLYQPVRGFGLVWRTAPTVREDLGWAMAPETGFQTWRQGYRGQGLHNSYTLLQGVDGTIYCLTAFGGVWQVYAP